MHMENMDGLEFKMLNYEVQCSIFVLKCILAFAQGLSFGNLGFTTCFTC